MNISRCRAACRAWLDPLRIRSVLALIPRAVLGSNFGALDSCEQQKGKTAGQDTCQDVVQIGRLE